MLTTALLIAERFDAEVHLFRAISVPPQFPAAAAMPPDRLHEILEQDVRRSLLELAGSEPRVRIAEPDLNTPQPWRAILAAASKVSADLIVVGSHGYHGWDHLLGTNASKIADRADRHVLVVHERPGA